MYRCFKFFRKIFINLKNSLRVFKLKNFSKIIPRKILLKYIKKIYFSNRNLLKNKGFLKKKRKYLKFILKYFFNLSLNFKRC